MCTHFSSVLLIMSASDMEVIALSIDDKKVITYTKSMLIKEIAKATKKDSLTIRKIYDALENAIVEILSSADSESDVSIRLFEGIVIDGMYIPEKTKVNNLTGKTMTTTSKIRPKARISRNYCEKITSLGK